MKAEHEHLDIFYTTIKFKNIKLIAKCLQHENKEMEFKWMTKRNNK